MRIIVTGDSGFIGKVLCRKLLERGHEVVGLSRTSKTADDHSLVSFRHIPYVMGETLPKQVISFSPETIVHLAWDGIPDFSEQKCIDNAKSQLRFLKETERLPQVKKIVCAGTCREYGAKRGVCVESDCIYPDSFFSWAKQTLSNYFRLNCQQRQIGLVWFRIFYVYGPGQRAESLIPTLIKAFKSELTPVIKNPLAANDYIYIEDVANAFIEAIENSSCEGTFNLGSGKATTVAEISAVTERIVRKNCNFSMRFALTGNFVESDPVMWADTNLSQAKLDWKPRISLVDGIELTSRSVIT